MRIERYDFYVRVVLSRRNVLALLHKLDLPASRRSIISGDHKLVVSVEDDAEHYADREPAGEMVPATEEFIRRHDGNQLDDQ